MKLERNDPCPCGSGEDFACCHYPELERDGFTDPAGVNFLIHLGERIGGAKAAGREAMDHIVQRLRADPAMVLSDVARDLAFCRTVLLNVQIKLAVAEELEVFSNDDLDFTDDLKEGASLIESVAERVDGQLRSRDPRVGNLGG